MALSVYAAWLRGPDISQNIQQIFKKYPKIDYRAFASSRRHYAADNRTARDILDLFGLSKFKGGNAPLAPLIKISLLSDRWLTLAYNTRQKRRTGQISSVDTGLINLRTPHISLSVGLGS